MQKTLLALLAGLFLLVGSDASAQQFVKLWPNGTGGTVDGDAEIIIVENARSMATVGIQVFGTFTGTLTPQCTVNGRDWVDVPVGAIATPSDTATTITAAGVYVGNVAGCAEIRVLSSSWSMGSAEVELNTVQVPLASSASVSLESAELSVGAQPASDPHAVQCSNGSVDSACLVIGTGTAGTAATGVVTVQGIASMTPVIVSATNLDVQIGGSDTLTVSGTVTANLSATDNAVLDDIADGIAVTASNLDVQSGGADLATAAAQTTANTSLSTIAGDTTDIEAAVEIIDNAIGPVNAGAATATASNIVGGQYNLTPPTFTDGQQGSLQLSSSGALLVSGGGGGTEYVVNAAAPANPTGNAALAERDDALSALSEVEGDWTNLRTNDSGALWTAVNGSVTVTDGAGALNVIVDSGTISVISAGDNNIGNVDIASAIPAGTNNIGDVDIASIAAGTNNIGDVDVASIAAGDNDIGNVDLEYAGTAAATGNGTAAGSLRVSLASDSTGVLAATQSGTWNVGTVTTVTGVTTVSTVTNLATIGTSVTPGTSAAHLGKAVDAVAGASDTGVLSLAVRDDALATLTPADGDYTQLRVNSLGALWVNPFPASPVATSYLSVRPSNGTSFFEPLTPYTHDTALPTITTVTGPMTVGRASATAPTNVTAGDAVAGWFLQDGSQVSSLAAGGSLITATGTSLNVNITGGAGSGGTSLADGATFTAGSTSGTPVIGFYESSPTTCTAGDGCAVGLTTDRELKVALFSGGDALTPSVDYQHDVTLGTVGDVTGPINMGRSSQAAPTDVTADGEGVMAWFLRNGSQVMNLAAGGTLITSGNGAASGAIRVSLANDSTGILATVGTVTSLSQFGGNAINLGTGTIGTGTLRITMADDDALNVNTYAIRSRMETGATTLKYTAAGTTEDEHAVCTAACDIYSITVTNTAAAAAYLRCENDTAGNTTPGSETVELDLAIPGATTGAGFTTTFPMGAAFSTAATCWVVTGEADTDVAEVGANDVKLFYTFKLD